MKKIYGAKERQDGLYCIGRNKWELIFGFGKDSETDETGYNYRERFDHKPTFEEVKATIYKQVDADTDYAIEHGMMWNGFPVHLTAETQQNIVGMMAALPLLGESLFPKTFKLGEYEDGSPVFYDFTSVEDFGAFAKAALDYKDTTYAEGWNEKALVIEENFLGE